MQFRLTFILLTVTAMVLTIGCGNQGRMADQAATKVASVLDDSKYVADIATFLQIGENYPAGLSLDGSAVFFQSDMSGVDQVYRITDEGWPYQLTTFESGIDFFYLSHNAQMAVVGASEGGSEQSQLYLMDTRTGRLAQLTNYEDTKFGYVYWAPDDKKIFYYSNEENRRDMFIYEMDIATGESRKIFGDTATVRGWNSIQDVSEDGNFLIIYHGVSNVTNDLYLLDRATGQYQKLNEDGGNFEYFSATLMPDNQTIWLRSNGNDDGILRLARMTVGSTELEFIEDGWLDPRWELKVMKISPDFRMMAAITNEDGYQRIKLRELDSKKDLPVPPLDGIIDDIYMDYNGNVLFSFESPTRAPDVWLWNPNSEELKQLTFALYAGIDRTTFSEPELIHYESYDGLEIPAFLYLPPDYKEGEQIPFVVYAHGGPESQFRPTFTRTFLYLPLNGYGILAPNPRGSSGYGREYRDLDNYKNRHKSLKDYKAGVDWLLENGYTRKGMLGIRGGSYGGFVVLGMITEYPDLFDAAIDMVGIANFRTFLENTKPYRRKYRETEYGPLTDPEFLESVSPLNKAHLIETPLLVIHGENDPRVPVSEARQIIQAINDRGGDVDSLIFPDEGHGVGKLVNVIATYRKQAEFLDRHLKVIDTGVETD
ncbi:MAG: S9 family peptidase [Candidatus Zixiibacteriota bacterium]|nr:MAG: S9 family peptidase [candidate division Zixibacteria bacterium]